MRVEWRCIIIIDGVQCVMIIGIFKIHKLYVVNWALVEQSVIHIMEEVLAKFGLMTLNVLVMKHPLVIVSTKDGETTTVVMEKILVFDVLQVYMSLQFLMY